MCKRVDQAFAPGRLLTSPTMDAMATTPRSSWAADLASLLDQPRSTEEVGRVRRWAAGVRRLRAEEPAPPGTFQRLLALARAEDEEPDE